jgi:signal transduction histidine kinase/ActR/RegA family two-component response regulator
MIIRLRKAMRMQLMPLLLGFLVLAAIVGMRSWMSESQREKTQAARQGFDIELRLLSMLSTLQDAETGQRGFLLTGEETYLEPYNSALRSLPTEVNALRDSLGPNSENRAQIDQLQVAIGDKFTELAEVLEFYKSGNLEGALAVIRTERGRIAMDRVREIIADIRSTQTAKLQQNLASADAIDEKLRWASIAALLGVLLLGIYGIADARRRMQVIEEAHSSLVETNKALEDEIETRQKAEDQIRQMQKLEAIGQLTGGIAHDFNNMLAVIISAMNLMQRKLARGDTDIGKLVDGATDAADRAAGLTQRLLAFARQQPLAPQLVDANRMVAGMSDLLRRTLGETIQIETVLAGGLWRCHADTSQLENSIINLAVNARDAMPEGGKLTIETANCHLDDSYAASHSEVPAGQYVLIAVTDTGTGMPREVIAKAFEPFYTTKPVSKGTGLGLSQVFGFVKQSNGHVTIYSEPDEGTTVKIYLPRYFGDEQANAATALRPASITPTELVLVVEDDERVRVGSVESLRELGYRVIHADGGEAALTLLEKHGDVSLLFTDIVMPGMSGRKLAEEAVARHPRLKVLYTTGFTRNAVVHNGKLDPGVNFLAKPFTLDQLAAKVRDVLDQDAAPAEKT